MHDSLSSVEQSPVPDQVKNWRAEEQKEVPLCAALHDLLLVVLSDQALSDGRDDSVKESESVSPGVQDPGALRLDEIGSGSDQTSSSQAKDQKDDCGDLSDESLPFAES